MRSCHTSYHPSVKKPAGIAPAGMGEESVLLPLSSAHSTHCYSLIQSGRKGHLLIKLVAKIQDPLNEEFSITLPARKLLDICKALPEGSDINFHLDENSVTLTSARTRFQLSSLPAKDFPGIDDIESYAEFDIP